MKDRRRIRRTVPSVVKLIMDSDDQLAVTRYENILICLFVSPLMFLSAASNHVYRYLILHEDFVNVLPDIVIFVFFGLVFEFLSRSTNMSVAAVTRAISVLLSLLLLFVVGRYYEMMGSSVWMVAFVLVAISLIRSSRLMLSFIGLTSLLCVTYVTMRFGHRDIEVTGVHIFNQIFLSLVLFLVSFAVNTMNTARYGRLEEQYTKLMKQKEEIVALYEEIAATDEELRAQNKELADYNQLISENEERLYYLAYYDSLTGLPNRKMILEELDKLIESSEAQSTTFYLVFIDLDNFKKTNDTLGHTFGDLFIQSVVESIKTTVDEEDILGRIGGDEFALIVTRRLDEEQVFSYVDAIRKHLVKPFLVQNREIYTTGSFGISMFPRDGRSSTELFQSADTSMYKAKDLGKNNVQFFNEYMKHEIADKAKMEHHMLTGIRNNEFFLVYQPQYYANSKQLRGFEALLRWNSPEFGVLSPREFIPLAEETRLIIPLGDWVLNTACQRHKTLQSTHNLDTVISVNLSTIEIKHSGFTESLEKALEISGLDPRHLEIEITESVFLDSTDDTIILLSDLKDMGVRIALDDFGTGYSSLSYLTRLPLDTLKIDKSFVDDMELQDISWRIIGDLISIAHHMSVFVVAEGVERDYQLEYLRALGCDGVQGLLLCEPLGEEDIDSMIRHLARDTYR